MHTTFFTPSGKTVDIVRLTSDIICITDIAQSLAYSNRYNGYLGPYSVAQHSLHVSERCQPEYALEGLLHDAAEAYVGDMVSPLKKDFHMDRFRVMEDLFTRMIENKFCLSNDERITHEIDVIDKDIVKDEVFSLATYAQKSAHCEGRGLRMDAPFRHIRLMPPELVKALFLDRFNELIVMRRISARA